MILSPPIQIQSLDDLVRCLETHSIDREKWGSGEHCTSKSVLDLWEEVQRGESTLQSSIGELVRTTRVVRIHVTIAPPYPAWWHGTPRYLFNTAIQYTDRGTRVERSTLVTEKLMQGEEVLHAVHRALHEELDLEGADNRGYTITNVETTPHTEDRVSTRSYPGIHTIYELFDATVVFENDWWRQRAEAESVCTSEGNRIHEWEWRTADSIQDNNKNA